ncbi:MAG: ABC-type amino acid transport system permease subunit [Arcticibacterium sp.]|jgi:ABC-type amino acid transport system permease subunit
MKKFKIISLLVTILAGFSAVGQKMTIENQDYSNNSIEMADVMRSEGKIYVLVAIIVVIFIGFIFFLLKTEQKLKKIEKEINK